MQLHWVDSDGRDRCARSSRVPSWCEFFAAAQPARVVMEACGSAHHWARVLGGLGHEVRVAAGAPCPAICAQQQGRRGRCTGDLAGGAAIGHPPRAGQERGAAGGDVAAPVRAHWVSVRTATVNVLRGLLYEFGVVLPGGRQAGLKALRVERAEIDAQVPRADARAGRPAARNAQADRAQHRASSKREIAAAATSSWTGAHGCAQMPGIGVLGATALAATLGDAQRLALGRGSSPPAWGWCLRTAAPAARCASGT